MSTIYVFVYFDWISERGEGEGDLMGKALPRARLCQKLYNENWDNLINTSNVNFDPLDTENTGISKLFRIIYTQKGNIIFCITLCEGTEVRIIFKGEGEWGDFLLRMAWPPGRDYKMVGDHKLRVDRTCATKCNS